MNTVEANTTTQELTGAQIISSSLSQPDDSTPATHPNIDYSNCPTKPTIKPLEDLFRSIPEISLPPAMGAGRGEASSSNGWDAEIELEGKEICSNSEKKSGLKGEEEEKRETVPSRVPQTLPDSKGQTSTSQRFSIRKHLRSSHFSKVN